MEHWPRRAVLVDLGNGHNGTGGEVPYSPDFSKMQQNVAPMGWQADEDGFNLGQEYNGPYNISCRVMQADHTNGVEHSITSPWIKLADGSNRVLMDVNMTCYQGRVNAPIQQLGGQRHRAGTGVCRRRAVHHDIRHGPRHKAIHCRP